MTKTAFRSSLEDIFEIPRGALRDVDTRDSVPAWTSVADVQILTLVTSELGVEPDLELLEAESVGDLIGALEERGVFAG
jgi:hypothetical protein